MVSSPLAKTAEEIRKSNPELVESLFKENIVADIKRCHLGQEKEKRLKEILFSKVTEFLSDSTISIADARNEIRQIIYHIPEEQTIFKRIKDTLQTIDKAINQIAEGIKNRVINFILVISLSQKNDNKKSDKTKKTNTIRPPLQPYQDKAITDLGSKIHQQAKLLNEQESTKVYPPPNTPNVIQVKRHTDKQVG